MKIRRCRECGAEFQPLPPPQPQTRCKKCITAHQHKKQTEARQRAFQKHKAKQASKQPIKPPKPNRKPLKRKINKEQMEFNAMIRKRDKGKPCISCGIYTTHKDAGHYISLAKSPKKLARHPDNVHGQCIHCNRFKHGDKQMQANYRKNLIERIGIERVEFLEKKENQ